MARLNIANPNFTYDDEDPEGFRAGMFRLGTDLGAERTGTSVYELPPGEKLCPYHYEWGEEEWVMVLSGRPWLRTPEGTERSRGRSSGREVLMWSEIRFPAAAT